MQQEGMNFIGANRDEATRIQQRMRALGQPQTATVPDVVQTTPIGQAAPPAAGATTQQQQAAPGARPQTDAQGRVLRHSRSQGDVYVNPNNPSDWVKAQ
jgi:hypothetical protein